MRKFISNLSIFLLLTSIFYILCVNLWGHYIPSAFKSNINYRAGAYGHTYSRLAEVKAFGEVDILFLGSSLAYRGFDSRFFSEYGFKTFNLGSSGQTPIQTKLLLNRYLDNLDPKVIIYVVYPEVFEHDGVGSSIDIISNDINDLLSLKMALKINNIKTYNTLICGYTRDLFNGYSKIIEQKGKFKDDDSYISGGFVEKKIQFYKPTTFDKKEISFRKNQKEIFSDIVKMINDRNIKLILVSTPISKARYNSYTNTNYFENTVKQYSTFYNFNEILNLNDSLHFYDAYHLNQNGVEIFNRKLLKLFTDNKILVQHKKHLNQHELAQ